MRQDAQAEPLAVEFRGAIPEKVKQYATEKLSKLERYAPRPILHAKVEIHEEGNPAIPARIAAKASIDVNGNVLHASVSGTTFEEAIDLLADRLRRQIERIHDSYDSNPSHRGNERADKAAGAAAETPPELGRPAE